MLSAEQLQLQLPELSIGAHLRGKQGVEAIVQRIPMGSCKLLESQHVAHALLHGCEWVQAGNLGGSA